MEITLGVDELKALVASHVLKKLGRVVLVKDVHFRTDYDGDVEEVVVKLGSELGRHTA